MTGRQAAGEANARLRSCVRVRLGLLLILSCALCGCWDNRDLDTLAIVVGMGVDRAENGDFVLTAQIARPGQVKSGGESGSGGQSSGSGGPSVVVVQSRGRTVQEAVHIFTLQVERTMYLSHNQVIVIGREAAREGVWPILDFFVRTAEAREDVWLLVAAGKASEVMKAKGVLETIPSVGTAALANLHRETGVIHAENLQEFIVRLISSTTCPLTAQVGVSGGSEKRVRLSGTAVFKGDRLVGRLNSKESRGFMWVNGQVMQAVLSVEAPGGGLASLEISEAASKVTGEMRKGRPGIRVQIKVQGNLGGQTSTTDLSKMGRLTELEKKLEKAIHKEVMASIEKTKQWNADVFGFGDAVHRSYPREWKKLERRWDSLYPSLDVRVKVEAELIRTGLLTKPLTPAD